MKNRGAFMTDLDKMEIRDIPMPTPKEKEVLVELEYVGICGSDVHYFHDGRCGSYVVDGDFMLGHECAGTVVELGEGVENLKVGDRVALQHHRYRDAMRTTSHSRRTCASNFRTTSAQKKVHLLSHYQ